MKNLLFYIAISFLSINNLKAQFNCPSDEFMGKASFYTSNNSSNSCNLPSNENLPYLASLSVEKFDSAIYCGTCIQIIGQKGSIIAQVTESSTGLGLNDLDLNQLTFETVVGNSTLGFGEIKWKVTACPFTTFPLELTLGVGSSSYYFNFTIHRSVNQIESVEVLINDNWKPLRRQIYNGWISEGIVLNDVTYTDVRVTDIFGQKIIFSNVNTNENAITNFADTNFTPCIETTNSVIENHLNLISIFYENNYLILKHSSLLKEVSIIDVTGKEIKLPIDLLSDSFKTKIDCSELTPGYYILKSIDINNTIHRNNIILR